MHLVLVMNGRSFSLIIYIQSKRKTPVYNVEKSKKASSESNILEILLSNRDFREAILFGFD